MVCSVIKSSTPVKGCLGLLIAYATMYTVVTGTVRYQQKQVFTYLPDTTEETTPDFYTNHPQFLAKSSRGQGTLHNFLPQGARDSLL